MLANDTISLSKSFFTVLQDLLLRLEKASQGEAKGIRETKNFMGQSEVMTDVQQCSFIVFVSSS